MKLGNCPVCSTDLDLKFDNKQKKKIKKKQKFNCPICGVDLFLELSEHETKSRVLKRKNIKEFPTISMGIEVESFTIDLQDVTLKSLTPIMPKHGIERDEFFTYDITVGSEYNSAVFNSLNEAFFRIKTGLRKYFINIPKTEYENLRIALMGSFYSNNITAGVHYHIGFGKDRGISKEEIQFLAPHIHQQIPFIIALMSNSPILKGEMTQYASNRLLENGENVFYALNRINLGNLILNSEHQEEISYSQERMYEKPPTLEIRVADTNLPEYIIAGLFIIHTCVSGAIKGKKLWNVFDFRKYKEDRIEAAKMGSKASFYWNRAKLMFPKYIDSFFNFYYDEIKESNVSQDILNIFRLAKKGWIMSDILREGYKKVEENFVDKGREIINKQFLIRYLGAQMYNLNGENIFAFAKMLNVQLPSIENVKLGRGFRIN